MALARQGSFTVTARGLHLTQSTLSKHIAALEQEFSVELFVRDRSGIRLTRAGEALYHSAQRILHQLYQTSHLLRAIEREDGHGQRGAWGDARGGVRGDVLGEGSSDTRLAFEYPTADVALRRRCIYAAGRFGLDERETGALVLYLEDRGFAAIQQELGLSRDELADVLAGTYRKLKVSDKQQLLDLIHSDLESS